MQVLIAMSRQDVARTFEQDIRILEHKVSLSHPLVYATVYTQVGVNYEEQGFKEAGYRGKPN
jgi:hypothetical protein